MTEKTDKLVRMANQIADFFAPYPQGDAAAGVAEHINAFWTKGMRASLLAHVQAGGLDLRPSVVQAAKGIRGAEDRRP